MIEDAGFIEEHLRRVTGLLPIVRATSRGWIISAMDLHDYRSIIVVEDDAGAAANRFLEENLRQITQIKLREQRGRCQRCGRRRPLQLHHRVLRSHGRDDRPENLELLDQECHEAQHNSDHPKLPITKWLNEGA